MRAISNLTLFALQIAAGALLLALPTSAATVFVGADTTITTNVAGDPGGAAPPDSGGLLGTPGIEWTATLVDVVVNAGISVSGGAGGSAGADASNDGGNLGGIGGVAINLGQNGGTLLANAGSVIWGGNGGAGTNGGSVGASDTAGGSGGVAGSAILLYADTLSVTLAGASVTGGSGGNGGAAGDAAADGADSAAGGGGGIGAHGILTNLTTNAVISINNANVTGGNGGNGGTSLANGTNASGGLGGVGIWDTGMNTTITIGAGSLVAGGDGGLKGSGGTGGSDGVDGAGVRLAGTGASLTNHGTILGSDTQIFFVGTALYVLGDTSHVDNYGTIGAASNHAGRGIVVGDANVTSLRNRAGGAIASSGSQATVWLGPLSTVGTFENAGSIYNSQTGPAVEIQGIVSSFTNSGTIESVSGNAIAIGSADVADTILNEGGIITSTGAVIAIYTDLGANGIVFEGGQITNSGGGHAIFVNAAQTANVEVKNASVTGSIAFTEATETLNVTASALNGDVVFTNGTNNLNFLGGSSTIAAGTEFSGGGGFLFFSLLAGADVVSNAEQTSVNSEIDQLMTISSSKLRLNESFWVNETVLNEGEIEIAPGKTLTSPSFAGSGSYVFGVADALSVARLATPLGASSGIDMSTATVAIKLSNPSAFLDAGTELLLAEDLDGVAIAGPSNGTLAADNSALLNFVLYRGDAPEIGLTSDLFFAEVQVALLADIAALGDDPNAIALGAALDAIGLEGDTDIDDLMLALALLPTNEDINEVLDSLLPETDGIAYDIASDMGDQALDVASKRLDALLAARLANEYRLASLAPIALRGSMNDGRGAGRFWAQAFGRAVDQSQHSYNTGYDAASYGFAFGADTNLDKATALGAAFSYTSTDADGNGINRTDTEVNSYQLTLYGDHLFDNAMYAKGLLAYGWHANDIARHDVGGIPGNTATGSYDADHITARAEFGRAYKGGDTLTLIPRAHLNAAWYSPDGYSEQGVGGLGLTVAPDDLTSVRLGVGVLARWDITLSGEELFQPELRLDYRRDLTRERFETTSAFLGAPGITFRTQGVEPAADILNLGVGALLATAGGVDLRASYDVELKEDYTAHAGYVRASVPF